MSQQPVIYYQARVDCGFPSPAQDYVSEPISLDALLSLRSPSVYLVTASGSSMEGVGIYDGDFLVVDRSLEPKIGSVLVVNVDGALMVKRYITSDGIPVLSSANPDYPDFPFSEFNEVCVWGVVTHSIRRHEQ